MLRSTMMKVLLVSVLLLSTLSVTVHPQDHYVPADILIPALNISTVQMIHNTTLNKTETTARNHTGFNNPRLNKTWEDNNTFNHTNSNGDLILGRIHPMDRRIFKQVFWEQRRRWSKTQKIVKYPRDLPGYCGRHETISAIRAFNLFYDGFNSKVEILAGGVGRKYVKMRLSSQWGKGFRYLVFLYGH